MNISAQLPREGKRDYALRVIRDNIVHLQLEPGSQLSIDGLSAELGLSRTPVREALLELSDAKVIELQPQKGSLVSLIDCGLVEESRFLRTVLECSAAELACKTASPADLERLRETARLQGFYLYSRDPEKLRSQYHEFHRILFQAVGKPHIFAMMTNISIHFDRILGMSRQPVDNAALAQDHADLCEVIAQGNAVGARALMEILLNRCQPDIQAIQRAYPQYFPKAA